MQSRHKRTEKKLEIFEQKCAKLEDDLQRRERELGDAEFAAQNLNKDLTAKLANLEHTLNSLEKDNKKLHKLTQE
jgi:hypothetical protein